MTATTITVTTAELHARLDELLDAARAGTEVLICDADLPGVKLSPAPPPQPPRRKIVFDLHAGGFISDDFAAPLPDDFWGVSE